MSDAATYAMTTVTEEQARELMEQLHIAAAENKLTVDQLHAAVATLSENPLRRYSVGLEFIKYGRSALRELIVPEDRSDFYMSHIGNPHIVDILMTYEMLQHIHPRHREDFIEAVTARHAMPGIMWLRNAISLAAGYVAGKQVLHQLTNSKFDQAIVREFAREFLLHGAGRVYTSDLYCDDWNNRLFVASDAAWAAVPANQLYEVIKRCTELCPEVFFTEGNGTEQPLTSKLGALRSARPLLPFDRMPPQYLTPEQINELSIIAACSLTTLNGVSAGMLMSLPKYVRYELAARALPGSLEFLVRVTIDSDDSRQCFVDYFPKLTPTSEELLRVFRNVYYNLVGMRQVESMKHTARYIEQTLAAQLAVHGYIVGGVFMKHTNDRGWQAFVSWTDPKGRNIRFVHRTPHGQRSPFFENGMCVIIDTNQPDAKWRLKDGATVVPTSFVHVDPHQEDIYK